MKYDPLLLRKKVIDRLIAKYEQRTGEGPTPKYIGEAIYRYERRFPTALGEDLKTASLAKSRQVLRSFTNRNSLVPVDPEQPELPFFAKMPLPYMRYGEKTGGKREDRIIGVKNDEAAKGRHFLGQQDVWANNFERQRRSYEKRLRGAKEIIDRLKEKGAESDIDWTNVAMWLVRDPVAPLDIDIDDFDEDLGDE